MRDVLAGKPGPCLEAVALNAGAALYVGGVASTLAAGLERARAILAAGSARERLEAFVGMSREIAA
jgi:anthranilate phosphoribosyltransferase